MDMDDDLLRLPEHHPDRLKLYYAKSQVPILTAMIQAKALTVSTPYLANLLRVYNSNIYVLPNYLDDSLWRFNSFKPQTGQKIRILFIGGITHVPDLEMILPSIHRLAAKYPDQLELVFYGANLDVGFAENLPVSVTNINAETYVYSDFVNIALAQVADIAIAPLEDNDFNRCKSNIKYLEYSAMGLPGVYSNVVPYSSVIENGVNGFLASTTDDWLDAISKLIESPQLRQQIVNTAQEDVRKNWLISDHAYKWIETYNAITELREPNKSTLVPFVPTFFKISKHLYDFFQSQKMRESDLSLDIEHLTYEIKTTSEANAWALSEIKRLDDEKKSILSQQASLVAINVSSIEEQSQFEHEKQIQELEVQTKEKIESLEAEHEKQIQELEVQTKEKIESLEAEYEKQIQELEVQTQEKIESLEAEHERQIQELEDHIDSLSVQWFEHTKQIQELETNNQYLKQVLDASKLESVNYALSTSWRITRPFRRILKHFRRK